MRPCNGVVCSAEPGRNATLRIAARIGSADDCSAVSDASDLGQDFALDTVVSHCRASCRVHLLRSQMPVISGNAIPVSTTRGPEEEVTFEDSVVIRRCGDGRWLFSTGRGANSRCRRRPARRPMGLRDLGRNNRRLETDDNCRRDRGFGHGDQHSRFDPGSRASTPDRIRPGLESASTMTYGSSGHRTARASNSHCRLARSGASRTRRRSFRTEPP